MSVLLGTDSFSYATTRHLLRVPLQHLRPGRRKKRYVGESDDYSVREVTTVGAGVDEMLGEVRYEDDDVLLLNMLEAGADGTLLHFHRKNWVQYPALAVDSNGDGVADGFTENVNGAAAMTGEDALMEGGRQKLLFTASTGSSNIDVRQTVYGITSGMVVSASVELEVANLLGVGRAQLILEFVDALGVVTGATNTTNVLADQAPTRVSNLNRVAPADAVGVRITLRARAQGTTGGSVTTWWKDLQLEIGTAVVTAYEPSWPVYLIEPSGDLIDLIREDPRTFMEYQIPIRLRHAAGGDFAAIL